MTDQPTTPDRDEQRFAVRAFGLWWLVTVAWWAFAFVPFGLELPALQRAQQVCFGTRPDGLPDAWGWGLLLVGPGSMLGFLLVVWGSALIAGLRAAWRGGFGKAAAAVAMLLLAGNLALIGRAVVATARIEAATQAIAADELPPEYPRIDRPAAELGLVDQAGAVRSIADEAGHVRVVTFAYAHCATICPAIVHVTREAVKSARTAGIDAHLMIVTLDPWRDTPSSLPGLAESWQLDGGAGDAVMSSSDVEAVLAVLRAWQVPYERDESNGEVAHPALVYVVDGAGRLQYALNGPSETAVRQAIERSVAQPG